MAGGFMCSQILYTAVSLSLADHIHSGVRKVARLARSLNIDEVSLYRFMRMMCVLNLLEEEDDMEFSLTPLGELLRYDHPESNHDRILYIGKVNYRAAEGMLHSVRTNKPAFDYIFREPFFSFFENHPETGKLFNEMMRQGIRSRALGLLSAYDFTGIRTITDVGGGNGTLASELLSRYPDVSVTVFDLGNVITEAHANSECRLYNDRYKLVAGDFFRDPLPEGADIYILSNIIHDWEDKKAREILKSCFCAMRADSRLLIIEELLPGKVTDAPASIAADFSMMLLTGGCERNLEQYKKILSSSGLEITRVIPFKQIKLVKNRKHNWVIIEAKRNK